MEDQIASNQTILQLAQNTSEASNDGFNQLPMDLEDQQIQTLLKLQKTIFTVKHCNREGKIKSSNLKAMQSRILGYCRKEKSLQSLSSRFIDQFEGKSNRNIQLDKVTIKLNVERRRMYDIINILQSLNIVIKNGKNNYLWLGLQEGINTIQKCEASQLEERTQKNKKEKSLQFLAAGFLRLLIHSKPAISLEQATFVLMKDKNEGQIKTKIRRLYDIINIFKSLGIIRKIHVPNKKTSFEYAGTLKLQQLIAQKSEGNLKQTKFEDKNDLQSKQTTFDKSPLFPFASKQPSFGLTLSNFEFEPLIITKIQTQVDERTSDNRQKFSLLGGINKFNNGFSAFKLVKNNERYQKN